MNDLSLTILYGTETGNCKGIAQKVAAKATKNGVSPWVYDLADYTVEQLQEIDHPVLFIISTWDEGLPPPKAKPFCDSLMTSELDLSGLRYTVLALGDTEYELYCECGIQVDNRLKEMGAECLLPRTDLGEDFLVFYIGWSKRFWKTMATVYGVNK